jgi:hypothetical protein
VDDELTASSFFEIFLKNFKPRSLFTCLRLLVLATAYAFLLLISFLMRFLKLKIPVS